MIRSAASKVMWAGRATVFMGGLAAILALVFGVTSTAFGANNGSFMIKREECLPRMLLSASLYVVNPPDTR